MSPVAFFPTEFVSNLIAMSQSGTGTIFVNGKITVPTDRVFNPGNLRFFLSANNGANYEEVTNGTLHTFSNPGSQLLYKIVGVDAEIRVNFNSTNDPIKIEYTTT